MPNTIVRKDPQPHNLGLTKRVARFTKGRLVVTKDPNGLTVEKTQRDLIAKRPGALSKDELGPKQNGTLS